MHSRCCWALAALLAVGAAAPALGSAFSPLWGETGEMWSAGGPLTDFSYAGYHQSRELPPSPPVTRWLSDFQGPDISDDQALHAALDWAHQQPVTEEHVVIGLPEGQLTLTSKLQITRPNLVLRGSGKWKTTIFMPKSLTGLYGPNPNTGTGGYIFDGAFIEVTGDYFELRDALASVIGMAFRGGHTLQVESTIGLQLNQTVIFAMSDDEEGSLARELLGGADPTPKIMHIKDLLRFPSRIIALGENNTVTLERPLPCTVLPKWQPQLHPYASSVSEVGIEELTLGFAPSIYNTHHHEVGFNAIQFYSIANSWVRNVRIINFDNGMLNHRSNGVSVLGLSLRETSSRRGQSPTDPMSGHWGVHLGDSNDYLIHAYDAQPYLWHTIGSDGRGSRAVFSAVTMLDGNMELHRNVIHNTLFTDVNVGRGSYAMCTGGPRSKGPSAGAHLTYWNIYSDNPIKPPFNGDDPPGECNYGVDIAFVGVKWDRPLVCPTWHNEPGLHTPVNLYLAQLALRQDVDPAALSALRDMQPVQLPAPVATPLSQDFLDWFYLLHDGKVAYAKRMGRRFGSSVLP